MGDAERGGCGWVEQGAGVGACLDLPEHADSAAALVPDGREDEGHDRREAAHRERELDKGLPPRVFLGVEPHREPNGEPLARDHQHLEHNHAPGRARVEDDREREEQARDKVPMRLREAGDVRVVACEGKKEGSMSADQLLTGSATRRSASEAVQAKGGGNVQIPQQTVCTEAQ